MEVYALRSSESATLLPCYEDDSRKIGMLKRGKPYFVTISEARNIRLHRKYFALINTAWGATGEKWRRKFRSIDNFRRSLTLLAGYTDPVLNLATGEWIESPRSISFERMGEEEFENLYRDTLCIIRERFLPSGRIDRAAFEEELKNF